MTEPMLDGMVTPAAPPRALADVDVIARAMQQLAVEVVDAGQWSADTRRRVLAELDRVVDRLAAVRAAVLVAERDSGAWQGAGDRSFEAWRARTCRAGHRSAVAQVRQAEHLAAVPQAAAAVTAGRVTIEHARVIGAVASSGTPAQQVAAQSAAGQRHLLALAEQQDAGTFATTVARWAATVDPQGLERDHQAQRAERYLHLAATPGGTVVKGRLDSIAGHRLTLALEALSPRPGADDDRDPGQRRADALDAMAGRILASANTKPGGHVPPQITMILTEQTWLAAQAERDRRRHEAATPNWRRLNGAGADADRLPEPAPAPTADASFPDESAPSRAGMPPRRAEITSLATAQPTRTGSDEGTNPDTQDSVRCPPATLEDGTPVPGSALAAAMCDCEITRLVIDADGAPLDVGRAQRVFTGPQRRAVIARDRQCAWPDCHAHARWCEVHHIQWWERDTGPTSVDNAVLLCSYHHHEVHRRDLAISRVPTGRHDGNKPSRPEPASQMAQVTYDFRDRAGRVLGHEHSPVSNAQVSDFWAPSVGPPLSAIGRVHSLGADGAVDGGGSTLGAAPARGAHPAVVEGPASGVDPPGRAEAGPTDEPDLTWTTDPVTGVRIPELFLVR